MEQAAKFDEHVVSTRIRAGRSIRGLPLPPGTNRGQRRKVEELISAGLSGLTGELAGKYAPPTSSSPTVSFLSGLAVFPQLPI